MNISPFIDIVEDLNRDLSQAERYRRLVLAIQRAIPCDVVALLKLTDGHLLPVAALGLKDEALARRFAVTQHPRLQHILNSSQLTRFNSDSPLPDPYDGLVDDGSEQLHVHDCMGSAIYIDGSPWGVLTLDAMQPGSFDSLNPMETRAYIAAVAAVIKTSRHIEALEARVEHNHQVAQRLLETVAPSEIIGKSPAIQSMRADINTVAPSKLSVLITGETGVGKELVAKSLHQHSQRKNQPLVQINCAALPENIVESELFGHVKGAFSGAVSDRSGRFELADGGTLFLDEVGELPLPVQAKLLRALQYGEIQRVGSDKIIVVDVRIVAATNRDLQQEVRENRFRADLYHRLSVYPLAVPPLREREKDFLLLAGYFLEKSQHQLGVAKLRLQQSAIEQLARYNWPGNVRELEHLLSRAALRAITEQGRETSIVSIDSEHLNLQLTPGVLPVSSSTEITRVQGSSQKPLVTDISCEVNESGLRAATDEYQRQVINRALENEQGNLAAVARALKLDRSNLIRAMRRLGLV
ncbi:nitric oxide reductase transcriptional regulator NorR [Thalassomonas viridans]|uniref:Nitric oxide reductase transcriptional regulator NorR n=1 Tax=Thalassomonas viridans TaxID=137584 RepID=A0AAF0CE57_9GAMM|nr:nitric oxide reductase transcriptional regulator NorR [Thalassomonas viridans]WDE08564.1 nitric oxide reductase transcriptional regulator NorR [Thalassomonas viridans]